MKFQNLRIGNKLWLVIGLVITSLACLVVYASLRAAHSQEQADRIQALAQTKIRLATQWSLMTEGSISRARPMPSMTTRSWPRC